MDLLDFLSYADALGFLERFKLNCFKEILAESFMIPPNAFGETKALKL